MLSSADTTQLAESDSADKTDENEKPSNSPDGSPDGSNDDSDDASAVTPDTNDKSDDDAADVPDVGDDSEKNNSEENGSEKNDSEKKPDKQQDLESNAGLTTTVQASSTTSNIVGDVFANSINYMNQAEAENEGEELELPSLVDYPLDPHERSYYDGSLRLRNLRTDGSDDEAYLVYRDTFHIVSSRDADGYSIAWSEDRTTAYISPAIDPALLDEKTGIVFLRENIGLDDILVFGGRLSIDDDGRLVVPIKNTDEIYLSELFSDGQFSISISEPVGPRLRSTKGNRGWISKEISGTNWSGELTDFRPGNLDASLDMNPWKLRFGLRIHVAVDADFDITSSGASGELETVKITSVSIPVDVFSIDLAYKFQAEFDEHPVHVKGTLSSEMDYIISTRGADVENFTTPIKFTEFDVLNESDANKTINLYLGTMFEIDCGILGIDIDLWVIEIEIGPVLKLSQKSRGGNYIEAYWEKDTFDANNPNRDAPWLHLCCGAGADGCIDLKLREISQQYYDFTIDLYFKEWPFKIYDDGEIDIATKQMYDSKAYASGIKDGICPHKLFNVPVAVWRQGTPEDPSSPAGANLRVALNDLGSIASLTQWRLAQDETDADGKANIFLPYEADKRNLITASGTLSPYGMVIGSSLQPKAMVPNINDVTNIILDSNETTELRVNKIWDVDIEGHEVPEKIQMLVLRKEPDNSAPPAGGGASGGWGTDDGDATSKWVPVDIVTLTPSHVGATTWSVVTEQPKYWLGDTALGEPYAYEYKVRELNKGYYESGFVPVSPIVPIGSGPDYYPDDYLTDPTLDTATLEQRREDILDSAVLTLEERPNGSPAISCAVSQYENMAGEIVLAHDAWYWVSYGSARTEDGYRLDVTNTAFQTVNISKRWIITKPDTVMPEAIYLTALWKPEDGWEDLAEIQGVPNVWEPGLQPMQGEASTLSELMNAGVMSHVDIHDINEVPLAIARETGENNNVWRVEYTLPKYRNGIPMQLMGAELNSSCIGNLLRYEYDLDIPVSVKGVDGFVSFPCFARGERDSWQFAEVLNVDTDPMHTIAGTKTWDNGAFYSCPDWLTIEIWDEGTKVGETTLLKADYPNSDTWTWSFCSEDINPDKVYTLVEKYPDGYEYAEDWLPVTVDHDIVNHFSVTDGVRIRIKVKFDPSYPPVGNPDVNVNLYDGNNQKVTSVVAKAEDDYIVTVPRWFPRDTDFSSYTIKETNLNDLRTGFWQMEYEPFYDDPVMSFDPGYVTLPSTPVYTYTVTNLAQADMYLPAYKEWMGDDEATRPGSARLTLYRDGLEINAKDVVADRWFAVMNHDDNGRDMHLKRVAPDGHIYVYTLKEEHVDGYWTTIEKTVDKYINSFTVTNELIGDRGVTLRGTVHWEGDTGKEHVRPEKVHIVAICKGETVASVNVPTSESTWEIRDLPLYDDDGVTRLEYSVLESHIDGYDTTYATPEFDENDRIWTCDLTNRLIGYFPLTVKKEIDGVPEGKTVDDEFQFEIEPMTSISSVDWSFPSPLQWMDGVKVQGAGEGLFEFLIDQEGMYLYKVREVKGTSGLYEYDESVKLVLIVATEDADGMMRFQSWVGPEGEVTFDMLTPGSGTTTGGDSGTTGGNDNQDPAPTPSGDGTETDTDGSSTDDDGISSDDWEDTPEVKKTDIITFTNKYGRPYSVKKKWDFKGKDETKPASLQMQLQRKDTSDDGKVEWVAVETITITETDGWKGTFSPVLPDEKDIEEAKKGDGEGSDVPSAPPAGTAGSPGTQGEPDLPSQWEVDPDGAIAAAMDRRYRIRELSEDGKAALAEDDEDNEKHEKQNIVVTVTKDGKEEKRGFFVTYEKPSDETTSNDGATGNNGTTGNDGTVEGDGGDTTDDNETIVKNTLGKLFTVKKEWKIDTENTDKPASIKVQLQKKENKDDEGDGNDQGNNQGNDGDDDEEKWEKFDEIELGDDNGWEGYFKLVELEEKDEDYRIRELNKEDKPVLAKDDKDLEGDDDEKKKYVPTVVYDAGDHETKYLVSYKVDDEKPQHTDITNTAVMDVSLYKRWLMFGDTDKPDSVYLMLLGRAKAAEGEDSVPYLPVNDVLYGNKFTAESVADLIGIKDKMESVSEIATGDKEKFMENIEGYLDEQGMNLNLAVQKVSEEKDDYDKEWHAQFGVPKYDSAGKEREFVGAELVTGLMKIGTDVMTGTDFPVMIQPIPQMYFTVFGYALNIFEDWELTGNVINTWFDADFDPDNPDPPNPPNPPVPPVPPVPVPPVPPVPDPPNPPEPDPAPTGQPIIGSKFWSGDDEDERPSEVKIHVYAQDGDNKWEVRGSPVTAKANNNWVWMLYLEPNDPAIGKKITVKEEVPDGYTVRYSGCDTINTKIPSEKKTVRGAKTWNDADNQDGKRPDSITIRLLADGDEVAHKVVTADDGWKWEFKDLPIEKDGRKIAYTVSEDEVEGYDTHCTGMDVTNTHSPETVKIHVSKVWDDDNNQEGKRPESVTVRLRIDGEVVATQELAGSNNWEHTFGESDWVLPRYWKGKEVNYSLTEDPVTEYSTVISEKSTDGFYKDYEVTNSCTPGKVQVHVTKVWDDDENCDGIRPESVTVKLMAGGKDTGQVATLSNENGWAATFDNLTYKQDREPIAYTVIEVTDGVITGTDGPGTYAYEVSKDTDGDYSYVVKNTHTPETVSVNGSKTWNDDDDEKGKRPSAIVVNLLADGKKVSSKTVTAQDDWKWAFDGLHKYAGGKKISYTIEESEVSGYDGSVKGYDIMNTPVPEPVTYKVEFYYQDKGKYPGVPDEVDERDAMEGESVNVTDDDKAARRERYALDETAGNVLDGVVPREKDGMLVLRVYFRPYYVITYDPNGGWFSDGGTKPISERHWYGDAISIHSAPARFLYEFDYWKGSKYQPGDSYTVTEDHTFVAQWLSRLVPPDRDIPEIPSNVPKIPGTGIIIPMGDDLPLVLGCLTVVAGILALLLHIWKRKMQ